ncbi:MAG: hypothetical protein ABIR33_13310 [Pyrinomonadaceae bacterium]
MRTMLTISFGVLLCLAFAVSDASAQRRGGINERQQNQHQRIGNGVRSGELTARETSRLAREQAHIYRMESRLRQSGGEFTTRERYRVQRELNQSGRHIRRQSNDRQDYPRP